MIKKAVKKSAKRKNCKKTEKYTKTVNIRLTSNQWREVFKWASKANLEPPAYIRKILLDFLNIKDDFPFKKTF